MNEIQQKRKPGRPPKLGPSADSRVSGEAVTGSFPTEPEIIADIDTAIERAKGMVPADLRARIIECNQVYIVCKTVDGQERTINHSRHDALWLKQYI